jgi:hypothetical protein
MDFRTSLLRIYPIMPRDLPTFNWEKHEISELLCNSVGNKECNLYSASMANNIIRVASERIFHDIYYSLKEPIANSIDSYGKMRGKKSNIGKFGLGFFSLLGWLNDKSYLVIVSSKETEPSWIAAISKEGDRYYYRLLSEGDFDIRHGTGIYLINIEIDIDRALTIISASFSTISDIQIEFTIDGDRKVIQAVESSGEDIISIEWKNGILSFEDSATGISLDTFYNSLLVPSVSTKKILSDIPRGPISTDLYNPTIIKSDVSQLIITVNGVGIYNTSPKKDIEFLRRNRYYINLPSWTPLPVSRDDVVLDNPLIFKIFFNQLIKLANDPRADLDVLSDLLSDYSEYANDRNVSRLLLEYGMSLRNIPGILLVPLDVTNIISLLSPPWDIKNKRRRSRRGKSRVYPKKYEDKKVRDNFRFYAAGNADLGRYEKYLRNTYEVHMDIFNIGVIFLEDLFDTVDRNSVPSGISSILFVDMNKKNSTNWKEMVMMTSDTILTPTEVNEDKSVITKYIFGYTSESGLGFHELQSLMLEYYDLANSLANSYEEVILNDIPKCLGDRNRDILSPLTHILYFMGTVINDFYIMTGNSKLIKEFIYSFLAGLPKKKSVGSTNTSELSMFLNGEGHPSEFFGYSTIINFDRLEGVEEYLLGYYGFFRELTMTTYNANVNVYNMLYLYPPNIFQDLHINKKQEIADFFIGKPYTYTLYVALVLIVYEREKYRRGPREPKDIVDVIKHVYDEISTKYDEIILWNTYLRFLSNVDSTIISIIEEIHLRMELYIRISDIQLFPLDTPEVTFDRSFTFTANQLIKYIFDREITEDDDWKYEVSKMSRDIPLQVVDIVVNTGTTKNFIESIMTELIQNSIDAIRNKDGSPNLIEINVSRESLSIKDLVGIPTKGLISLLIPFMSNKSSGDVSTGEMGTGFFNLYRQPYISRVTIHTRDKLIDAVPIIDDGRVVDIEYTWNELMEEMKGTVITVHFREQDIHAVSTLISEVFIYIYTYLHGITPDVKFNGEPFKKKLTLAEETDKVVIYFSDDKNSSSVLLTNGVPHSKIYNKDVVDHLLNLSSSGLVVDLKKGSYTPVQSRKRIDTPTGYVTRYAAYLKGLKYFNGNDRRTLQRYESLIHGITYMGDPWQVAPDMNMLSTESDTMLYYDTTLYKPIAVSIMDILESEDRDISYNHIMEGLINKGFPDEYNKIIATWFKSKQFMDDDTMGDDRDVDEVIKIFTLNIVKNAWKTLKDSPFTLDNVIMGDPPLISYKEGGRGYLGLYDPGEHIIYIGVQKLNLETLKSSIVKYNTLTSPDDIHFMRKDETLSKYCGFNAKSSTLIHEFLHALEGSEHIGGHGQVKYQIGNRKYDQNFDLAANEIWRYGLSQYS